MGKYYLPADWDDIKPAGDERSKPIAGAYVCKIVKAYGNDERIKFNLDIADGEFAGYFSALYDSKAAQNLTYNYWGLQFSVPMKFDDPQYGNFYKSLFKRFANTLEATNPNFKVTSVFTDELFVGKNAHLRYSTIENWSKNMYNLNTKRAICEEGGTIEWISGSFGSHESYLYPTSVLKGDGSHAEFTGITFAGKGQNLDTGARMVHLGKNTSSFIDTKSICKSGGISTYRSSVEIRKTAEGAKASVNCGSLMLDSISRSDTVPAMDIRTDKADVGHEAKIGRISDDAVFYMMSRGISEAEARAMIVSGFANPVSKERPLEYAAEMNNLIKLEMEMG